MEPKPTIKMLRIRKGWSVRELSVMSGVSEPAIYRVERNQYIRELLVSKLAIALGTTIDEISYTKKKEPK